MMAVWIAMLAIAAEGIAICLIGDRKKKKDKKPQDKTQAVR